MHNNDAFVLKIKDSEWENFKENADILGFSEEDDEYILKSNEDRTYGDCLEIQISKEDKTIKMETVLNRYGGIYSDGSEFVVIYDLIMKGYVEKIAV